MSAPLQRDGVSEPVCARCVRLLGMSCCEVPDGQALATLTDSDVARIAAHTGRSPATFAEDEWLTPDEVREYEEQRPLYLGYFRAEPRRRTLRQRGGACVFLEAGKGCTLPDDIRPTACVLYPFDLAADGSWSVQVERHGSLDGARAARGAACLAVEEAESVQEAAARFGRSVSQLEAVRDRLRAEVLAHGRAPGRSARGRQRAP